MNADIQETSDRKPDDSEKRGLRRIEIH